MAAMMRDKTGVFYQIYDESETDGMFEGADTVIKADSIEELAKATGMDANTLQDTINRYNELKDKEDVDFGKASD